MEIIKSSDNTVMNASKIFDNLKTLIKYKEFTSISKDNLTSMLDESYELKKHRK